MRIRALGYLLVAASLTTACNGGRDEPAPTSTVTRDGPPSFLVISIDTTRADRLGTYGYRPSVTPNLDAWADEGVVFERALTPVPVTLPAHASIMTGLFPHRHGARDNGTYRVPRDLPTLATSLSAEGYDTAAVVAAAVLDRQYGLDRGFERYDDGGRSSGAGLAIAERNAGAVTDAAIAIADELEPPFFMFLHYFDPHASYAPPSPFAERFRENPYDGELAYVDDQLGRLRRELSARGRLDDTVVVVTSDHGEGLGDHGELTHGVFLYQSTLHVPLFVVAPGRWPSGTRVSDLVSLVDIAPTLYQLAGTAPPEDLDGTALSPSDGSASRLLPLESEFGLNAYGWAPLIGLTDGTLKWIGAPHAELYDLTSDPNESRNVARARVDDVARLETSYRTVVSEDRRASALEDASLLAHADRLAQLESLGYVASSRGERSGDEALADPKNGLASLASINEARQLLSEGRHRDAAILLERVSAVSPRNVSALVLTGAAYLMGGNPHDALAPLERAARVAPANADVHFNMGLAMLGAGRPDGAESAWRRTLALAPRHEQAAVNVIDLLIRTGKPDEAAPLLDAAREQQLASPLFDYLEGKLAILRGDRETAQASLNRALTKPLPEPVAADTRKLLTAIQN